MLSTMSATMRNNQSGQYTLGFYCGILKITESKSLYMAETQTEPVFIPGHHEAEICYGGEADLHKHYTGCKKNPGHVNFIPVNDFNLGHLPSRYRDVIMLELIKALSALTVLIKVKYTSLERPKSVPCFSGQYPFYNTRGSDVLRTGTGWVRSVFKFTESYNMGTCPCGKCQHSDTPSKVWGEVTVETAAHVVFDVSETRQTRCVVGFDDNKSQVVSLDGWEVKWADIEGDVCVFTCVSCDLELVDELDKMRWHFEDLCGKVRDKYERFHELDQIWRIVTDLRDNVINKYWRFFVLDKLAVIVSHPHGCPKQVSVGQWTHRHKREGMDKYTYTYTTCTCPGSSGACVYMPRYEGSSSHPHSGSNSVGNYCGEDGNIGYVLSPCALKFVIIPGCVMILLVLSLCLM
ncbi:uncharacterized protein LOC131927909 isoform X2 [Physella acuta]|uniref:uncharacterized protein LOC131927909 isoform X2 n=1 Tax=Physella acuta TaxID=109671 RepID=UPI0027DD6B83|nr:uncharacterized protein LOC131927909 isoform X2 [Physella acuta]